MSFWNVVGVNLISALDIGRVAKYFLLVGCVDTASAAFLGPPQGGGHLWCSGNMPWSRGVPG